MEDHYPHDFSKGLVCARCGHVWGTTGQCPSASEGVPAHVCIPDSTERASIRRCTVHGCIINPMGVGA